MLTLITWTGSPRPLHGQEAPADSAARLRERADSILHGGSASDLRQAMNLKTQALALYRRSRDRNGESSTLRELGELYEMDGEPDSGLAYHRLALEIQRTDGDKRGESETLHDMGALYANRGMPDSALTYLRQALPLEHETGHRMLEGETVNSIGYAYRLLGQFDSALTYYAKALQINRELGNRSTEGAVLNNTGRLYSLVGRPDSALSYYQAALRVRRAVSDRRGEAITLNAIAMLHEELGQLDSAVRYLKLALPIRRETGDRRGEAVTLSGLAGVFADTQTWDSALAYQRRALDLHRAVGDRGNEARSLAGLGLLFKEVGDPDSASLYVRQSLAVRRELGDRMGEGFTLEALASLYRDGRAQNLGLAVTYYDSAAAVLGTVTRGAGGGLNRLNWADKAFLTVPDWALSWLRRSRELDPQTAALAALAVAERGRAQALLELMRDTVTALLPGADFPAEGRRLAASVARTGSAGIVYMITRDTLLEWVIRRDTAVEAARIPIAYDALVASVADFRRSIGADDLAQSRGRPLEPNPLDSAVADLPTRQSVWMSSAIALADVLLPARVRELLADAAEVVVVPQWSLALVPFAALPSGPSREPFGARVAVRYAPSLATLDQAERRPRRVDLTPLVVGNPLMPEALTAAGERGTLAALPGADAEARTLATRLGVAPLRGAAATESEVRRRLPGASIVHLATHAFTYSSEVNARASFIALAPDGANDGLLSVGEILDDPDLSLGADLITLSACQTGLGDLKQSEGTIGLQRAFLAKGARSVLVSLWSVSDVVTAELMTRFYTHWLDDPDMPSKAEALRRAQEDIRTTPGWEHPRYWAAFQLVGAG